MRVFSKFIFIILFIISQILCGQVTVSDAFQNTLKKISKERVKNEIIDWISKQDILVGIVSKDLITQLIDNGKNEEAVLKSTANVTATMLYLGGIKRIAESFLEEHIELVDSSKKSGLNQNELIAYTALYYYYSERIKYNLYVSSEILKMQNIKTTIANLQTKEGQLLPAVFGRYISKIKHGSEAKELIWLDVRVLEYIQLNFTKLLLDPTNYRVSVESTLISLRSVVKDTSLTNTTGMRFLKETSQNLIEAYQKSYKVNSFFILDKSLLDNDNVEIERILTLKSDDVNNILAEPFNNLIQSSEYSFVDMDGARKVLVSIVRQLLEQWINGSKQSGWKWDYKFALGGTYFSNYSQSIDFTILDQLRFEKNWESSSFFIFVGGFFDPLIKNTIYKGGVKVYLAGIGYQYSGISLNIVLGIPYTDLEGKYGNGLTVGYEVPIFDAVE
jgi:hypothetical protein